ncbi:zinc finger protein BRUTUS-like At1g74770 isoform X1 [Coffea arabica]|uniref:Zinc finger protein BRUTUS-like At1g74770 isoform X1 n=1 Tax=Coffea arabica TaxID=13443 RepID=A0ABM4U5B1_COFAR|nr:zinc finger protein BRUTUS-like At1g74770 isoform X1 [Coffea arabica]
MAGEEPEKEDGEEDAITVTEALLPCLDGAKLVDAPILFFVLSHKAFVRELEQLHRSALEVADIGSPDRQFVDDLGRRFDFFKLVYKYHAAAEDEIVFPALNSKVKNVVTTSALEHKCINDDFCSTVQCLDLLRKECEDFTHLFQKLIFCISSIKSAICEHMLKEEKLVFPLLIGQFPSEEQAKLVWQYICSVPIALLEDFLPWMACSLPPDEQLDLLDCMKIVVSKEEVLEEVVISWLNNKKPSPPEACNVYGQGAQFYSGHVSSMEILKIHPNTFDFGEEEKSKLCSFYTSIGPNPLDGIYIWNTALARDFRKVLDELYQIRSSNNMSNLSSIVVQLQFLLDVLISYSNALNQIFFPLVNDLSKNVLPLSCTRLVEKGQVERLQFLLYGVLQDGAQPSNFLKGLCREVELLVRGISQNLTHIETEVYSSIGKKCSHNMLLWLLYAGLKTMPLGLLKCAVLWFSATLLDEQFKTMLDAMTDACPLGNKPILILLHSWVRMGYLGKISMERFAKDLQENFIRGIYFTSDRIGEDVGFSNLKFDMQACTIFNTIESEPSPAVKDNKMVWNPSSSHSKTNEKLESGGMTLHKFSPQMWSNILSVVRHPAENGIAKKVLALESRPMDHFVCFHKALIRDLDYIVFLSANMAKSFQFIPDLRRHFELLKFLYDIHSASEDEVVFPALESKGKLKNITQSYTIDHKLEEENFAKVSSLLNDIATLHDDLDKPGEGSLQYRQMCLKLHETCLSMQKIISGHIHREEIQLWPLFGEYFSTEEQEKMLGCMLGRTRAETLQEMIPWLMSALTQDEQHALISLWRRATKNTNFEQWLGEWWEDMKDYCVAKDEEESSFPPSLAANPLEVVSVYLGEQTCRESKLSGKEVSDNNAEHSGYICPYSKDFKGGQNNDKYEDLVNCGEELDKKTDQQIVDDQADKAGQNIQACHDEHPLELNQKELETAIRRVSRDPTLDSQKKSHIIQSLIMSRWIVTQQNSNTLSAAANDREEDFGQYPSYQDSLNEIFGCKHYKRNCKLLAACCSKLFTCIKCHDEFTDHSMERKAITKMMCMKCLVIQPVGPKCSNNACNNFPMAKYYCPVCKLFDDERKIYHCPYCNLCRVGKGLGIDYFHCMNCNACMSRSLSVHICREKCFEDNCPICHEYIFTSSSPVKALPCGHLMHSVCFQEYTYTHYTCPICSKSLGDMQVYFGMLDALLAEEKVPQEYSSRIQVILCNDCERKGNASFHWLYHKCPHCGSYNTRLL